MNNQDGKAHCQTFFTRHQMTKVWFSECSLMTIYIRTAWSVCVETAYYQAYPQFTISEYLAVKSRSLQFPKGAHVICIYTKIYILLHLGHEYDHWWKTFSQSSRQKLENRMELYPPDNLFSAYSHANSTRRCLHIHGDDGEPKDTLYTEPQTLNLRRNIAWGSWCLVMKFEASYVQCKPAIKNTNWGIFWWSNG